MQELPEEDYNLQFFPKPLKEKIQALIEYRVKLILKSNGGGEVKVVNTCCILEGKWKDTKLSMFLIPGENTLRLDF